MTQTQLESIAAVLAGRHYLYSLFHQVFSQQPQKELLDLLCSPFTAQALGLFAADDQDALAQGAEWLPGLPPRLADPDIAEAVENEYMHLFIGPGKLPAPPWESVYRGKQEFLFTDITLEVRDFYRSQGYLPQGYPHVADDSLGLELDFMAKLSQKALELFQAGNLQGALAQLRVQNIFLSSHLLTWVPQFVQRMQKVKVQLLYPRLVEINAAFLQQDQALLAELIQTLAEN